MISSALLVTVLRMGKGPNSGQEESFRRILEESFIVLGEKYGESVCLSPPLKRQGRILHPCFFIHFGWWEKLSQTEPTHRAADNKNNSVQIKLNSYHTRLGNCFAFTCPVIGTSKISYCLRQLVLVFRCSKLKVP